MEPKLHSLLRQGERAMRLGKRQAATDVYRTAVAQFPQSAEAWMGLSQVVASEEERAACTQRARELGASLPPDARPPSPVPGPEDYVASYPALVDVPLPGSLGGPIAEPSRRLEQVTEAAPPPVAVPPVSQPASLEKAEAVRPLDAEVTVCAYHSRAETTLRCNRCSKPICTQCAIRTPVGYRCKDCVNEQQEMFYSARWYDYALAVVVALPLAVIAPMIIGSIGWLTIILSPFAGMVIAEAVRLVIRGRRGRRLSLVVSLCVIAGSLLIVGVWLVRLLGSVGLIHLPLGSLLWQLVYVILAASSAYYRLK